MFATEGSVHVNKKNGFCHVCHGVYVLLLSRLFLHAFASEMISTPCRPRYNGGLGLRSCSLGLRTCGLRPMTHDPSSWSKFLVRENRTRNLDPSFARDTHKKLVQKKWRSAIRRKRSSSGSFVVYDE